MKILHIASSLSLKWGGPTSVIANLSKNLVKKGMNVTIVAPFDNNDIENIIKPQGVIVKLFKKGILSKIWTAYSNELGNYLYKNITKFDLIHIHESWSYPGYIAFRAAIKYNKPYILTPHGTLEPWCLKYKGLKKRIYLFLFLNKMLDLSTFIHALTNKEEKYIRNIGVKSPIFVIPNGIEPEDFQKLPRPEEFEQKYTELKGKKVLLFLGRIHPIKGLDILVKAFGKIAKNRNDIILVIVGPDNSYKKYLESILKREDVLDKTIFTGILKGKDKLRILSRADICIIPSYSEGRSIVALEAMICKLAVIITRQCYFPEVEEFNAGIIIEPKVNQLIDAMLKLINDSSLRKKMGENGRQLVLERFTWDKIAEQMIHLYKEVLNGY